MVAALLGLSWLVSYASGGAGRIPPHLFYVPILLAAARFGLVGAAVTAAVGGLIAGPLLPLDVAAGTDQPVSDWVSRLGFFLVIGLAMAAIVVRLRTSLQRELVRTNQEQDAAVGEDRQRTRAIIETANDALVGMSASGVISDWNRAAEGTFGWTREEATGRVLADTIIPERYRDDHWEGLKRFLATGRGSILNTRIELDALHRKGHEFPVELTISAVEGRGSISFIAFIHDITERKQTEEALRSAKADAEQARAEAERANLAKSEFLSRMSHELRTPLNAVLGFAQLLDLDVVSPDQKDATREIIKAGEHLLDLINEVLDIAAIEAGKLTLSLEPVDAIAAAEECISLLGPLADTEAITLTLDRSDVRSWEQHVVADRQRLKQVLLNLISNGIKYNRQHGHVRILISPDGDGRLRIDVADTGNGIDAAKLPQLFTPFDRLGAEASGVEGTGLGLALAKSLIEAMGGTVSVASEVGKGTTFSVELDRAEASPDTEDKIVPGRDAVDVATSSLSSKTVLYIEDNLSNIRFIERLTERRPDLELIPAMQGSIGLILAREQSPDLILLDVNLPDITGLDVLLRLQADPQTADIPVVMLSADATRGQVNRMRNAGASDYLTKPIDVNRFYEIVDRYCAGS